MSCWCRLHDWQEVVEFGTGYTKCCWPDCALRIASTGHVSSSTPPPFVLWDQLKNWTQSGFVAVRRDGPENSIAMYCS